MGFWHTGYLEFHEPVGLDNLQIESSPPAFPCAYCNNSYPSIDDLRKHRFEGHPIHRPILYVRGRELGTNTTLITRRLVEDEVRASGFDRAFLNGDEIAICAVPKELARITTDVCHLVLIKSNMPTTFTLDFRIASEQDLKGIETQFENTTLGRRLDIRTIDEFISATSGFGTAIAYCDGICTYLYGVLAKESSPDSTLPHESYVRSFNKAAEELADYERPLARTIRSLIEFHFNHFSEASRLAGEARVGYASHKYVSWIQGEAISRKKGLNSDFAFSHLESLVTDWNTEQIIRWAVSPFGILSASVRDMESFLKRDIEEYDKVKLHVLLGEFYSATKDISNKLRHARALRNLPKLGQWAESMIRAPFESCDQHL